MEDSHTLAHTAFPSVGPRTLHHVSQGVTILDRQQINRGVGYGHDALSSRDLSRVGGETKYEEGASLRHSQD